MIRCSLFLRKTSVEAGRDLPASGRHSTARARLSATEALIAALYIFTGYLSATATAGILASGSEDIFAMSFGVIALALLVRTWRAQGQPRGSLASLALLSMMTLISLDVLAGASARLMP